MNSQKIQKNTRKLALAIATVATIAASRCLSSNCAESAVKPTKPTEQSF